VGYLRPIMFRNFVHTFSTELIPPSGRIRPETWRPLRRRLRKPVPLPVRIRVPYFFENIFNALGKLRPLLEETVACRCCEGFVATSGDGKNFPPLFQGKARVMSDPLLSAASTTTTPSDKPTDNAVFWPGNCRATAASESEHCVRNHPGPVNFALDGRR